VCFSVYKKEMPSTFVKLILAPTTKMAIITALCVFALATCSVAAPTEEPKVIPEKLIQLSHSIDTFGQKLLQKLELDEVNARRAVPKNLFISPLSISSVLSTLLGGAANETHKQLYETLG